MDDRQLLAHIAGLIQAAAPDYSPATCAKKAQELLAAVDLSLVQPPAPAAAKAPAPEIDEPAHAKSKSSK